MELSGGFLSCWNGHYIETRNPPELVRTKRDYLLTICGTQWWTDAQQVVVAQQQEDEAMSFDSLRIASGIPRFSPIVLIRGLGIF